MHQDIFIQEIFIKGRPLPQPAAQQVDQLALPLARFDGRGGRDCFPQGAGARAQAEIKGGGGHDRILAPHRHWYPYRWSPCHWSPCRYSSP